MDAVEKRARELLAAEYEKGQFRAYGPEIRSGGAGSTWDEEVRAIIAALTPPAGYVLVPLEPTAQMLQAAAFGVAGKSGQKFKPMMSAGYIAMLAARPEVP